MQRLNDRQRMRGTVEKVRIAESDVLRPTSTCWRMSSNTRRDRQFEMRRGNRHNRAVTAENACSRGWLPYNNRARLPGGHDEPHIFLEWNHSSAIGE